MIEANKFWRFELHSVVDELTQTKTEKKKKKKNHQFDYTIFRAAKLMWQGSKKRVKEKKLAKIDDYISFNLFDLISVRFCSFQFVIRRYSFPCNIVREIFLYIASPSLSLVGPSAWPFRIVHAAQTKFT